MPGEAVPPEGAQLLGEGYVFPEGPALSPDGALFFSDVRGNKILRHAAGGFQAFFEGEGGPNGLAFAPDGSLFACFGAAAAIMKIGPDGKPETACDEVGGAKLSRPNDLAFDYNGNLYFSNPAGGRPQPGQPAPEAEAKPTVCLLKPDGSARVVIDDRPGPNGVGVSADGKTLYVNDTRENATWAYPIEADGGVGEGRMLIQYEEPGIPDGMAPAASGNLWIALNRSGKIVAVAPEGEIVHEIAFGPDSGTTNLCFGGEDMRTLFVTCGRAGKVFSLPAPEAGAPLYSHSKQ